ncbi:MAG TPA: hypothetical protein DDY20_04250 [Desulfobulbaceae bacterium]|nr:hypothetical protein [Desulfobulbaceae bacterium]
MSEEIKMNQDHLQFLESLDKVNRAIQGTSDLRQMMRDVLDAVMSIFDCDRIFLLYPCDPEASSWSSSMERTKAEYPGVHALGLEMPMDAEVAEKLRVVLASDGPVNFGPESEYPLPAKVADRFNIKSFLSMAIYPKSGKPWEFGMHQCSYARVWTPNEKQLFGVIGQRIADALSVLLSYQELLEQRKFVDDIVENIPNMIFVKDAQDLRFVRLNKAGEQLLGYSRQELLGKNDYDFFPKEEADFFWAKDHEALDLKKPVDIPEETIQTRLKGERILHTQKIPILNEAGRPVYLLGISEDITERKNAEERLRRSEHNKKIQNRIASVFLTIPDEEMFGEVLAILLQALNSKFGLFGFIETNGDLVIPSMTRGIWNECQVPGKSHVFSPGSWGASCWGRAIREKTALFSNGPFHIPEGHVPIGHFLAAPIVYGEETIGLISVANNERGYIEEDKGFLESVANYISPILNARLQRDRRERERARMEESVCKLSQAIEQSPVSIVITDVEGRIEFVNAKFTQITGYSYAEVLGRHTRILKSNETPEEEYRRLWNTISAGGVWQGEFHNRKKDGELFWEHATIAPVRDANNVISHYVAVKEDITGRKKLEEELRQSQKMEAVGQLAGGVAHDFNNMLGVIIGYAQITLNKVAHDDSMRKNLEEILKGALRSSEITRQLLAFARKQTIEPKILDLNDTVEGMLKMLRRLIGENIDLVWLPGANGWLVKMDPSQLDQILVNLCVNARDSIAELGKITIETQKVNFEEAYCVEHEEFSPGEYVMLAVSDNGGGMDKRTKDKIFEPFFTTKGVGRGTGLGLATVYGIVKQNAGFINVYSEPGYGSVFKVYLPRHVAKVDHIKKDSPVALTVGGHETILLVEDESAVLGVVKMMLEGLGYTVLGASTPGEALRIASENSGDINLLITDLVMPEMTGRDLAKNLTSLYRELKCLFMSGYTSDIIARQGILDEGVNFIQKPFSKQELATKVREVLDSQ